MPSARGAELKDAPDPAPPGPRQALVRTLRVGFCGTDREILRGGIAVLPPGSDGMVIGHEMVGVVEETGPETALAPGQLVVPLVRRGCGRCDPCRVGRSDFCLTGDYVEHGITRLDGFARPWVVLDEDGLVAVPDALGVLAVLAEPVSVVEKALEQAHHVLARVPGLDLRGPRWGEGKRALVAGVGTIGLLAVYLLTERGFEVECVDLQPPDHLAARLAEAAGASYSQVSSERPDEAAAARTPADVVIEATGDAHLAFELLRTLGPAGVLVWIGTSDTERTVAFELGRSVLRAVLNHHAVVATVNASRNHVEQAVQELTVLRQRARFGELVTGVLPPERFTEAIFRTDGNIKQVVAFAELDGQP